jgi:hypothetical protein
MVDPGRKHLQHIIQMNLLQQQQLIDRPYTAKSLLHFQQETKTTNDATKTTTITTSAMPVTTSSSPSPSPNGLKPSTTLEQLQMQYQHIMTQMQIGLSSNSPTTTHSNYSIPEHVSLNNFIWS